MIDLTNEQRDALLKLGSSESDAEVIAAEILEQLNDLGLVYKRPSDGHLDFTDLGESSYSQLTAN